jgi:hypothetical protein
MPALNLAYQCKWCDANDLWLGHNCRPCGSKIGKCRAPQWNRIRATVTNVDEPDYTAQFFLNGTASQCCGTGSSNPNAFNAVNGASWADNPFAQTGVRFRYRSYGETTREFGKLCFVNGVPQLPRPVLFSVTRCGHWIYNLHWHYWSRLNNVAIYLSRRADDACKYRVTLKVSGVHLLAHSFQYLTDFPEGNCAGQYGSLGSYSGVKSVEIFTESSCSPPECNLLPNALCAMPEFLEPAPVEIINLAGTAPFTYYMSRDLDELTDDTFLLERPYDSPLSHCDLYAVDSEAGLTTVACPEDSTETFPSETNWENVGGTCENCTFQSRFTGGFATQEIDCYDYDFALAAWNRWNVQFAFV